MTIDLPVIWFAIIVFATLMYIVMDGFDLGVGILFPFIRDKHDRDVMVNSVAPVWDGNETAGAGRGRAFRRVPVGLCRHHRRADYPAGGYAAWSYLSRRRF